MLPGRRGTRSAAAPPGGTWRWCVAFALLLTVGLSLPWRTLETMENLSVDFRHHVRGGRGPDDRIAILGIGDSSFDIAERAPTVAAGEPALARMAGAWPWDRRVFATVVRTLRAAGARAIVFDVVFGAVTGGDAEFAAALREPGAPVVLAAVFLEQRTPEGEATVTWAEPRAEFLAAPSVTTGFASLWPEPDGVVRRARPTYSLPALLAGEDLPTSTRDLQPSLAAAAAALAGGTAQPAAPRGFIDFRGPAGTFPIVPLEHLFLPDRWAGATLDRGAVFRNRIVFVGPVSELRFKDYHATPFGRMPGVELQANIVSHLLDRPLAQQWEPFATVAAIAGMALLAAALSFGLGGAVAQLVALAVIAAAWLGAACVLFAMGPHVVPVVAPLAGLLGVGGFGIALRYAVEQRERRRLRQLLGSYVSEEIAEVVSRQPGSFEAALRGERREVAVLFADIRGFTSLLEHAEPAAFVAQLNEYLRPAVDAVLATRGTLQKFIGDAILAVWGDTHSEGAAADATHAVETCLALRVALGQLNAGWTGRADRMRLQIGVGVCHGPVMLGNIGHPRRMEFTVLGDTVNLAARLEGANRVFGTTVLVGETVRQLAGERFHFAPVARVVVKGRQQAVAVFTPVARAEDAPPPWFANYLAAYEALQAGRRAEAAAQFAALPTDDADWTPLFFHQLNLTTRLAADPAAPWDGRVMLDTK
jgi:adenylate cyclase